MSYDADNVKLTDEEEFNRLWKLAGERVRQGREGIATPTKRYPVQYTQERHNEIDFQIRFLEAMRIYHAGEHHQLSERVASNAKAAASQYHDAVDRCERLLGIVKETNARCECLAEQTERLLASEKELRAEVRKRDRDIAALERRVETLSKNTRVAREAFKKSLEIQTKRMDEALRYRGVFRPSRSYEKGDAVTGMEGALWACLKSLKANQGRPGTKELSEHWAMMTGPE